MERKESLDSFEHEKADMPPEHIKKNHKRSLEICRVRNIGTTKNLSRCLKICAARSFKVARKYANALGTGS
ncbi:unnamed protein product [Rhizophagus irregularis]|nr:unnamed protein product [Rhizophagus irregularis]